MAGEGELLEVVGAVDSRGGHPDFLHGGKQQTDQDRDERDRHQEFDQREGVTTGAHGEAPNGRGGRGTFVRASFDLIGSMESWAEWQNPLRTLDEVSGWARCQATNAR